MAFNLTEGGAVSKLPKASGFFRGDAGGEAERAVGVTVREGEAELAPNLSYTRAFEDIEPWSCSAHSGYSRAPEIGTDATVRSYGLVGRALES